MKNCINIGSNREVFWDDYLVDTAQTTATSFLGEPVKVGCDMHLNAPYESHISYPCLVPTKKGYRMYYSAWRAVGGGSTWNHLCVIESEDGIHWTRPELGIISHNGSTANNIVIEKVYDSFFVFRDPNPACPPEALYKAVGLDNPYTDPEHGLWCYTSPDGYHFTKSHLMSVVGRFDTLNTVRYQNGRYACYIRNFHNIPNGGDQYDGLLAACRALEVERTLNEGIRDVRVMYSDDFVNWSFPELIKFDDGHDDPLYTNQIIAYPRAPQVLVGFPTRYVERYAWTPNYDRLGCAQWRQDSIAKGHHPRLSLAITDCIFICSRDEKLWHRNNKAFMNPGYEYEYNWVYGDCYPAYGFVDTGDENYYMYTVDHHLLFGSLADQPEVHNPLHRWKIRKEGFAGYEAGEKEQVLVTKPLTFEGSKLFLNFATSAYGHIYVDLLNEDGTEIENATSFEIFGNHIDAPICLADGRDYAEFAGKPVRLRFRMLDAKLYALRFA